MKTAESYKAVRYRVRVAREGPSLVDKGPTIAALRYARAAGITWREMGRASGVAWQQIERIGNDRYSRTIARATRDRILAGVSRLLAARAGALEDASSALDFARGAQPVRKMGQELWPTEPLRHVIDRAYPLEDRKSGDLAAPPISEADRRYLYRQEMVDTARADRVCVRLGIAPEAVWGPAWFGMRMEDVG